MDDHHPRRSRLPDALQSEIRAIALEQVRRYAVLSSDFAAFQAVVSARIFTANIDDRQCLELLLPALAVLRFGMDVTATEVLDLAAVDTSEAGRQLAAAVARFNAMRSPGKALGNFMSRSAGMPVAGLYLLRFEPAHRRDSWVYRVAGIPHP